MSSTRAYAIEDRVFGGRFAKLMYNDYGLSVSQQQAIVDDLSAHWTDTGLWGWWSPSAMRAAHVERAMATPIKVRRMPRGSTRNLAYTVKQVIALQGDAGPALVCHEFAHIAVPHDRGHGADWRHAYVIAVAHVLGDYHASRLNRAFLREYKPTQDRAIAKRRR